MKFGVVQARGRLSMRVDEVVRPDLREVPGYLGAFAWDDLDPVLYKELFVGGFYRLAMNVQQCRQLPAAGQGGSGTDGTVAYELDQRVGDLLVYGGGGMPVYGDDRLKGQHGV